LAAPNILVRTTLSLIRIRRVLNLN
jgi:hypothetical protein